MIFFPTAQLLMPNERKYLFTAFPDDVFLRSRIFFLIAQFSLAARTEKASLLLNVNGNDEKMLQKFAIYCSERSKMRAKSSSEEILQWKNNSMARKPEMETRKDFFSLR